MQDKIGTSQPAEDATRSLVAALLKGKSRDQIAKKMSVHARQPISKRMLDDWTAASKKHRFPAAFVEAFCEAMNDDTLRRHVMGARLRETLKLGELRADLLKGKARRKS